MESTTVGSSSSEIVLVAGATGLLGNAVARRLLAHHTPLRATSRSQDRAAPLGALGADLVIGDLRDRDVALRACAGVGQIVSTANNHMGSGRTSPNVVDLDVYRTLLAAARECGVRRIVHVSARALTRDSPVDFFRVKYEIDELVKASGVPYVLVQPSSFMEIWAGTLIGDGIRDKGVATLFGDGRRVSNFIAVDDVATYIERILGNPSIEGETIVAGGPSDVSYEQVAALVEKALGVKAKRRRVPVPVLRAASALLRPFFEVPARLMRMGLWSATRDMPLPDWKVTADRFGVTPQTIEAFIAGRYSEAGRTDGQGGIRTRE